MCAQESTRAADEGCRAGGGTDGTASSARTVSSRTADRIKKWVTKMQSPRRTIRSLAGRRGAVTDATAVGDEHKYKEVYIGTARALFHRFQIARRAGPECRKGEWPNPGIPLPHANVEVQTCRHRSCPVRASQIKSETRFVVFKPAVARCLSQCAHFAGSVQRRVGPWILRRGQTRALLYV